ncbi:MULTISPECIES: DeoR/GlpR family DNA-binding transcription regulator [Rhodobacterales]|uniref:DeoR/GlpR family DNA-binding transcription regulator n=1 Tax=Roseobacter sp. N2S TaxID=2663844 RepID=UPI002865B063|nr:MULTISPECIES: DeoR/GlpR family DNA-binding transcription regulator [Rhodobacterales]MDR6263507.1 DeoR family glycerol-3-phosphate regulon repressor [Roseobacter sp. N2S]
MSKYEAHILHAVDMRGTVSVVELSQMLGVSDQTIRRVTQPLVEGGRLSKVHGALVSNRIATDPPFLARMNLNRDAKVSIAKLAAEIIEDGASIAIDTGSTSGFIAQALRARKQLTVVTNSAFVASTLAIIPGNKVFMAGTQLRDHDGAAFDRSAFDVIERMQVDYALLSASMVDAVKGFLVHEQCEVEIATAMLKNAGRAIMAVDHSKFTQQDRRPAVRQPTLKSGDIVLTDRRPSPEFDRLFTGLDLRIAAAA